MLNLRHTRGSSGRIAAVLGWVLLGLVVCAVTGFLALRGWILSYLGGSEFQQMLSRKTSELLKVEGAFQPVRVNGSALYTDGFRGQGRVGSPVAAVTGDQIRAEVNLRAILDGEWRVDDLTVQRLKLNLAPRGIAVEAAPTMPSAPRRASWLPSRVALKTVEISEFNLEWVDDAGQAGALLRSQVIAESRGAEGWALSGTGGVLQSATFPEIAVDRFKAKYRPPVLYVTEATLREGAEGTIALSGQIGEGTDLKARLAGIEVGPYLPEDWRVRLSGKLQGEVDVKTGGGTESRTAGTLRLVGGQLQALPILDQIAAFTRTDRFRRLALTHAEADFSKAGAQTEVKRFFAESEGLLRVEGSFTVVDGQIAGEFQVGVTPASLQWLPGAQEKVFTARRNGYLWTPMRVTGNVEHPSEDLSSRLVVAAGGAVIEGIEGTVREATKSILDLATPLIP